MEGSRRSVLSRRTAPTSRPDHFLIFRIPSSTVAANATRHNHTSRRGGARPSPYVQRAMVGSSLRRSCSCDGVSRKFQNMYVRGREQMFSRGSVEIEVRRASTASNQASRLASKQAAGRGRERREERRDKPVSGGCEWRNREKCVEDQWQGREKNRLLGPWHS